MRKEKFQRKNMIILQNIVPFVLTQLAYYSTLAVPEYSNHFVCKGYQKPHNNILPRHKHEI